MRWYLTGTSEEDSEQNTNTMKNAMHAIERERDKNGKISIIITIKKNRQRVEKRRRPQQPYVEASRSIKPMKKREMYDILSTECMSITQWWSSTSNNNNNNNKMEEKRKQTWNTRRAPRAARILIWVFGYCVCVLCVLGFPVRSWVSSLDPFVWFIIFRFCFFLYSFSDCFSLTGLDLDRCCFGCCLFMCTKNRVGVSEFGSEIYYLVFTMCLFLSGFRRHVYRLIMLLVLQVYRFFLSLSLSCLLISTMSLFWKCFGSPLLLLFDLVVSFPLSNYYWTEQYALNGECKCKSVAIRRLWSVFAFPANWSTILGSFFRWLSFLRWKLTFFAYR